MILQNPSSCRAHPIHRVIGAGSTYRRVLLGYRAIPIQPPSLALDRTRCCRGSWLVRPAPAAHRSGATCPGCGNAFSPERVVGERPGSTRRTRRLSGATSMARRARYAMAVNFGAAFAWLVGMPPAWITRLRGRLLGSSLMLCPAAWTFVHCVLQKNNFLPMVQSIALQ